MIINNVIAPVVCLMDLILIKTKKFMKNILRDCFECCGDVGMCHISMSLVGHNAAARLCCCSVFYVLNDMCYNLMSGML